MSALRRTLLALLLVGGLLVLTTILVSVVHVERHEGITIIALVTMGVTIVNTGLLQRNHDEVKSRNGTPTGAVVDEMSERQQRIETQVDAIEVQLRELRKEGGE